MSASSSPRCRRRTARAPPCTVGHSPPPVTGLTFSGIPPVSASAGTSGGGGLCPRALPDRAFSSAGRKPDVVRAPHSLPSAPCPAFCPDPQPLAGPPCPSKAPQGRRVRRTAPGLPRRPPCTPHPFPSAWDPPRISGPPALRNPRRPPGVSRTGPFPTQRSRTPAQGISPVPPGAPMSRGRQSGRRRGCCRRRGGGFWKGLTSLRGFSWAPPAKEIATPS